VCLKLEIVLPCCRDPTSNCSHCAKISETIDAETKKHQIEIATLQERNTQPETETAEQRYLRLRDEKDAEIERLKAQVDAVQREDQEMKDDVKKDKVNLDRLKDELKKQQPKKKKEARQEFFIKEAKQKKGRKK
jgi:hypothetical protein